MQTLLTPWELIIGLVYTLTYPGFILLVTFCVKAKWNGSCCFFLFLDNTRKRTNLVLFTHYILKLDEELSILNKVLIIEFWD